MVRIGHIDQIPKGEGRNFDVGGRPVAVFRGHDDRVYATQAVCPHKGGPLADGLIGGTTLLCPLHEHGFDMVTGTALSGDCALTIYPVQLETDGVILLDVHPTA